MKLSAKACEHAKPQTKQYKLSDGGGMYLLVVPSGSKLWRLNYRYAGKSKTLALGIFPTVALAEARDARTAALILLRQGIDPSENRREQKILQKFETGNTFAVVGREWHAKHADLWSKSYGVQVSRVIEKNLFPKLGEKSLNSITPELLLATLREMEDRGATDLLKDALNYAERIFRYGRATGRAKFNPAHDLKGAFKPHRRKHHATLRVGELPQFLQALDAQADGMGKLGIQLVLLTLVRTTEARAATWDEFDIKNARWTIPAERMKGGIEHCVPLSRQALELLETLKARTGGSGYLFPSVGTKHDYMSENTMLNLIYEMKFKGRTTVHGLRSLGSTILHESSKFRSLAIERQLAHVDKDDVRDAYNRAEYFAERKKMMAWWADYLDKKAAKKTKSPPRPMTAENSVARRN